MQRQSFLVGIVTLLAFTITCFAAQAGPVDTKYLSNVPQYVQYESAPGAFRLAAGGGLHTLKIMMVDPEVVLERIVVNPDNAHPSYFGAPETCNNN